MAECYFLTDKDFMVQVRQGALSSIKCTSDERETEYALPGDLFGELALTYRQSGKELSQWFCNRGEKYRECEPVRMGRDLSYRWETADNRGIISITSVIGLSEGRLIQVYSIKNLSDAPVEIMDALFALTPSSTFEWGDKAAEKVIGHTFVGGHGSHYMVTRCDGKGKYLLVIPYSNVDQSGKRHSGKWEFFDQGADIKGADIAKEKRNSVYVYEYSVNESHEAEKHGYKPRITATSKMLEPGEETSLGLTYMWAEDYEDVRKKLVCEGVPDILTVPGYTVPRSCRVKMCITFEGGIEIRPKYPENTTCSLISENNNSRIFELVFEKLGENSVDVLYGDGCFLRTEFFVTEGIKTLINKRGAFIASHQIRDEKLWYNGLLAEWNNKTGAVLSPDNYDTIKGWRIYEVTCDDPGLSKPAFLSGKLFEYPVQEEINALDDYIEHFVWGGLQCTEAETYPYGIYGIPDWKKNRDSDDHGVRGKEHLWRIYDYPHIALMYFNMYRIAKDYDDIKTLLSAGEYLKRAFRTAVAMFTIPLELEEWSAYETGLYNELIIPKIIDALKSEGMEDEAGRLERHWNRKAKFFALKCKDLFGSEYPFDTTGFESTHALAKTALGLSEARLREDRFNPQISHKDAVSFLENQMSCNIACRGYLEPTYYWYGSDYRANNHHYTLSYMSQMGGWAVLDYALYYAKDPYPLLRLGYGSILSSWALLSSGDKGSDYGFFFPGKENDGAACGGFEPLPYGETWLEQPHSSGPWYYSCEIDLGFSGAIRAASTILAEDPVFGRTLYGGTLKEYADSYEIFSEDGVGRRFHIISPEGRLHVSIDRGHFVDGKPLIVKKGYGEVRFSIDTSKLRRDGAFVALKMEDDSNAKWRISCGDLEAVRSIELPINGDITEVKAVRIR